MPEETQHELDLEHVRVRFRFSAHTDRGAVRRINEDSFYASVPVFIVADGMGGHAFGDQASQAAVRTFATEFTTDAPATAERILETVRRANDAVLDLTADEGPGGAISGTTLTGLAFVDDAAGGYSWMVVNVGDSRTYIWDGGALTQVSVDHSAVQELVELGLLTKPEAERHPDRNIVTRALGADTEVDPDVWFIPAARRQTFLICSDGLTKELADDGIARIVAAHDVDVDAGTPRPTTLAERLVDAAVAAGGSDNVTVVVVESDVEVERGA